MSNDQRDYDDVDAALVYSRASLRLMEKFLLFLAGRDPALVESFAQRVVETTEPSGNLANPFEVELELAALGLQKDLAAQLLSFLRRKDGRPRH